MVSAPRGQGLPVRRKDQARGCPLAGTVQFSGQLRGRHVPETDLSTTIPAKQVFSVTREPQHVKMGESAEFTQESASLDLPKVETPRPVSARQQFSIVRHGQSVTEAVVLIRFDVPEFLPGSGVPQKD